MEAAARAWGEAMAAAWVEMEAVRVAEALRQQRGGGGGRKAPFAASSATTMLLCRNRQLNTR